MTDRDSWHTVTVEPYGDGTSDDDPDYTLTHPDTCECADDTDLLGQPSRFYLCLTASEFAEPDGNWPTEPGTYQVRGHGYMRNYVDGAEWDGGLEWHAVQGDS